MTDVGLLKMAETATEKSYCPYSHFSVGAALLCKNGKVFTGCNVENSSFSLTNCAERTAVFKAVSEGCTEFSAIAIVGGPDGAKELDYCYPCGVCRQVMSEFCGDEFRIIVAKSADEYRVYSLPELLPERFGPKDLLG